MTDNLAELIRTAGDDAAAASTRAFDPNWASSLLRAAHHRRVLRQAGAGTAAACVAAVIGAAALHPWTTTPPAIIPTPTRTTTLTPTASTQPTTTTATTTTAASEPTPTPSATHPTGRNPTMTDAEALERIAEPQTGENWFGMPKSIQMPAWAADDEFLSGEGVFWYELGTRGDTTIIGLAPSGDIEVVFERGPDGTYRQIDYPSPRQSAATAEYPVRNHGVAHDKDTYYDSFALPAQLALPSGDPLTPVLSDGERYIYGFIPRDDAFDQNHTRSSSGVQFGGFEIVRDDESMTFIWDDAYGIALPAGLSIVNWSYLLRTPWGTEMLLDYDPLGPIEDVAWDPASSVTNPDPDAQDFADLNESACCGALIGNDSVVRGLTDSDWVAAGRGKGGRRVYIATTRNPLLATMYRLYTDNFDDRSATAPGGGPLTREEWRLSPGLIAYKTPLSGSWVVYLNGRMVAGPLWG